MFRVGTHNNRNVYFQLDPDEPDRLVCTTQTQDAAAIIAVALGEWWARNLPGVSGRLIGYSTSVDVSEKSDWTIKSDADGS